MQLSIDLRPLLLSQVFGHTNTIKELSKYQAKGEWPKALLFKGLYGVGKTTLAQIVAMTINCTNPTEDKSPCGKCASCMSIIEERFDRDTLRLDGGAAGKGGVIDFAELAEISPMYDRNKVFIIEEADALSTAAKNVLLKLLEKPTKNTYFILLSMVQTGIPPAIQSRCQVYNLKPFTLKDTMYALKGMMEQLGKWNDTTIPMEFKTKGLMSIAESANGSLRDATQYLQKCLIGEYYTPEDIKSNLGIVDSYQALEQLFNILQFKPAFFEFIESADIADFFNFSYAVLSTAIAYRITREAQNEYYEDNYIALNKNPKIMDLLQVYQDIYENSSGFVKKSYFIGKIAEFYINKKG